MADSKKSARFVLTLALKPEPWQKDLIDKRMKIAVQVYNSAVNILKKRYNILSKSKEYRDLIKQRRAAKTEDEKKKIDEELNKVKAKYGFNEYQLNNAITPVRQHFAENMDGSTSQKLVKRVWQAMNAMLFHNGEEVHYKRDGDINSLEGQTNAKGIRFKNDCIYWNPRKAKKKLIIPVVINRRDQYQYECLQRKICYCRIVRKMIRGKYKYYVQLILVGIPPKRYDNKTGDVKQQIGKGDVGLDIGVSTIAVVSENSASIFELADRVQNIERERYLLSRKLQRSRQAMNPNNYNSNGTIKCKEKRQRWINSNRYLKLRKQLIEICRKQAAIRKLQHECLANYLLTLGDTFYVEDIHFNSWSRRSKETKKTKKGKFQSKKRFGKTIAHRAPGKLLEILNRKLGYSGRKLIKINTAKARASQFNHLDQSYQKKPLSQRWNDLDGRKVQRDMYSAFLIMNTDETHAGFDLNKCNARFENFMKYHDMEVKRLTGCKNLSCIGI